MAKFQYTAIDSSGKEKKGFLEAEDDMDATSQLKMQGLFPTSVITVGGANQSSQVSRSGSGFGGLFAPKIKSRDLTVTTRQLSTLLEAGLPLVRALRTLQRQAKGTNPAVFKVLGSLAETVEGGATFSEALTTHPRSFNKLYVSMIRAGEASGAMEVVLSRLAEFMEKAERIAGKVKSAMVYPISVLVIALSITGGLMIFIIPKFGAMFAEMLPGIELPAITQFVMNCSDVLRNHIVTIIIILVVSIILFKMALKTRIGAYLFDLFCLKVPPFNGLIVKNISARFCRTLGTLMASGVAILQSLMIVKDTCGNDVVAEAIFNVHEAVKEGEGMTKPLESSHVFPLMLCSMVEVGEETGALPDMLNRIANVYEEEVDRAVESLTSLIEPLMIIFLAGIIGTIVVALFAPMVSMIENMGYHLTRLRRKQSSLRHSRGEATALVGHIALNVVFFAFFMIFHAEQLNNVSRGDLGTLTVLDGQGFICGNKENALEFSKRLQALNDNLQQMEDMLCTSKEYHIEGIIAKQANRISPEFYDEPGKLTKELYDFQCKWVPGFFTSQEMNGFLFGGCALSFLPDFFALFLIRNSFKKRQNWLFYNRNELLAHELCHIARIALNSSTYEEIFAYRTSPSAFRRHFGGIFHSAWDSYIFLFSAVLLMVAQIIQSFVWYNLPTWPFWGILGGVVIGMILRHIFNLGTLRRAKKRLENIFQIEDAWPILFRCTDDEINIFGGFSEHKVQNFIDNCRNSSSLRWKIILNKWALSPKWPKND